MTGKLDNVLPMAPRDATPLKIVSYEYSNLFGKERYNPDDLASRKGLLIYRKMMQDEQVKAVMTFRRGSITARGFEFLFPHDSPLAPKERERRVKIFKACCEKIRGSFQDGLNAILTGQQFGFSMTEKVYDNIKFEGRPYTGLAALLSRDACWFKFFTDKHGVLDHIEQHIGADKVTVDIKKFIHYVHAPEVDRWYGESDLRAAHRSWYTKDVIVKLYALYLERFAGGFAYAEIGSDANIGANSPEYRALQTALSSLRDLSSLILPPGVKLTVFQPSNSGEYREALTFFDLAIAKSVLVPNLLGLSHTGQTGAYSQSQTQLEAYFMTTANDTTRLEDCLNEQLFRDIGDLNFGDGEYPRFKFKPASIEHVKWIVGTWKELCAAGAVLTTEADEKHLRELLDMPVRTEEDALIKEKSLELEQAYAPEPKAGAAGKKAAPFSVNVFGYNPNQPREPAGKDIGGQWSSQAARLVGENGWTKVGEAYDYMVAGNGTESMAKAAQELADTGSGIDFLSPDVLGFVKEVLKRAQMSRATFHRADHDEKSHGNWASGALRRKMSYGETRGASDYLHDGYQRKSVDDYAKLARALIRDKEKLDVSGDLLHAAGRFMQDAMSLSIGSYADSPDPEASYDREMATRVDEFMRYAIPEVLGKNAKFIDDRPRSFFHNADHDEKSHGNWARGGAAAIANDEAAGRLRKISKDLKDGTIDGQAAQKQLERAGDILARAGGDEDLIESFRELVDEVDPEDDIAAGIDITLEMWEKKLRGDPDNFSYQPRSTFHNSDHDEKSHGNWASGALRRKMSYGETRGASDYLHDGYQRKSVDDYAKLARALIRDKEKLDVSGDLLHAAGRFMQDAMSLSIGSYADSPDPEASYDREMATRVDEFMRYAIPEVLGKNAKFNDDRPRSFFHNSDHDEKSHGNWASGADQSIIDGANKIAAMDKDVHDNTNFADMPGGWNAHNLYEGERLAKKEAQLKRVTHSNSSTLHSDYDAVIRVDGRVYGVSKYEDPDADDDNADDDGNVRKFVYAYTPLDNPSLTLINTLSASTADLIAHIRGKKNMSVSRHVAFTRALNRVDFAVIDNRTSKVHSETVDEVSRLAVRAIRRMLPDERMAELLDADVADIGQLSFDGSDIGKIKGAFKEGLGAAWATGQSSAERELKKAAAPSASFSTLRDKAADYFEANGFRMAANLTDGMRSIIQNELLLAVKEGARPELVLHRIYDRLIRKGYITMRALEREEPKEAVLEQVKRLLAEAFETANVPAYLNTLIRTNTFEALNEARYAAFEDPDLAGLVVAYEYSAILDQNTTEVCSELDDSIWAQDNPIWDTHRPPNHYNCRSLLVPILVTDKWDGVESAPPSVQPQDGF